MALEYNILGNIKKDKFPIKTFLEGAGLQDVVFNIASEGGSIFEGLTMAGIISEYKGKSTAKGIGVVASAATVVMLAADKKVMTPNSFFMIHNSSAEVDGNAAKLEQTKELLEKVDEQMLSIYVAQLASKGKLIDGSFEKTRKKVKEMMDAETWLTSQEAKDMGFIDEIVENTSAMTMNPFENMQQLQMIAAHYKNVPEQLKNQFKVEKESKKTLIQQIASLFGFKAEISDEIAPESAPDITAPVAPVAPESAENGNPAPSDAKTPEQLKKEEFDLELAKVEQLIAEKQKALETLDAEILAKSTASYKSESTDKKIEAGSKYTQETIIKANAFMKSIMK
jgi:ATP-dependent protease ClpP protease subunit